MTNFLAKPGLWMQNFTTFEPDDSMIEVAIEAMKRVIPEEAGKDGALLSLQPSDGLPGQDLGVHPRDEHRWGDLLPLVVGITYEFNRYVGGHDNPVTNFLAKPGLWMQNLAEDGLVLRAVIGEGAADVLHPGDGHKVGHEDGDAEHRVHERGSVTFLDSMVKGVKALMFSADYYPEEDVGEPSKFEKWPKSQQ